MNQPSKTSLRSSARSITSYSRLAMSSVCTTLQPQISNRREEPLSCAIGQRWPLSNTEARVFERVALSCSQPELPDNDHIRDGWLPRASAEQSRPCLAP